MWGFTLVNMTMPTSATPAASKLAVAQSVDSV
jgi:hypothetical protein